MKKAIVILPLRISARVRRLVADAIVSERWAGMEEAAKIVNSYIPDYLGTQAEYALAKARNSIRAKIEAEKKEAGR